MNRQAMEHLIRAVAEITNEYDIVVIGSQSILGQFPQAPSDLLLSMELDVYPKNFSEKLTDVIDGCIGEDSPFHSLHGYYAQGVSPSTAILPVGWEERLVPVQNANTNLKVGHCLEVHDLTCSKLAAGRPKDFDFAASLLKHNLAEPSILLDRLSTMSIREEQRTSLEQWIRSQWQPGTPGPKG